MRPTDLALLRVPGAPTVSPDGRMAVVAVARADLATDGDRGQLWAVPTDGSAPARPLTTGARDSDPAFSPDGRWVVFLRAEGAGHPQVHVLPTAGGAPRRLAEHPLGAGPPVWAPDSRRLAYTARVPEPGRYGTAPGVGPEAEPPRLVTTLAYRGDEGGFVADRRRQLFVVELPEDLEDDGVLPPAPVQLTSGDADCDDPAWSPDGTELAVVRTQQASAGSGPVRAVCTVRTDGSRLRRLTDGHGWHARPVWAPDGRGLHVLAGADRPALCRLDAATGEIRPLFDPTTSGGTLVVSAPVVIAGAVLVTVERCGAVELLRIPADGAPDGGRPAALVEGPFTVRGAAAGGGVVVATVAHDRSAGELIAITPGRRRLLTAFGRRLGATGRLHRSAGGPDADLPFWTTAPRGSGPHPVLLVLDGDPEPSSGWRLQEDTQVFVSAGYAVVRLRVQPGTAADDVLAVLDAATADPRLDAGRVGLLGGEPAADLLARTDRFAAGVLEGAPCGPPPGEVATPMLVVAAEDDRHHPVGDAERFYAALRRAGVPGELLLFPSGGALLARSGRPSHRLARLEHLLRWWDRWLPVAPDGAGDVPSTRTPSHRWAEHGQLPGD